MDANSTDHLPLILEETHWQSLDAAAFPARVVEVHKRYAFVSPESTLRDVRTREVWLGTLQKKFLTQARTERNFICVGDRVLCLPDLKRPTTSANKDDIERCVIQHVAPRSTALSRVDPLNELRKHVLAANMDQLLIVASYLNPKIKWGLIDRYLCIAELNHLPAIIVLNKKDALEESQDEDFKKECISEMENYKALGYPVINLQANSPRVKKSTDFYELSLLLKNKISIVSGHSGVGKSSLVNLFRPEIVQDVEPDDDIFYKGRHTTSFASFIKLEMGAYIIDTPGIRSFLLNFIEPAELANGFREFRSYVSQCKYRECQHNEEPDCAVKNAVLEGKISVRRYHSYLGQLLGETGREGRTRNDN
ncbi:MAG: ribosome small subunit-dependent GTPase A [Oligoflexales bacterium]|nr:ribosome small subunit-dependent GTPase A [Oligoflexales bacterium]